MHSFMHFPVTIRTEQHALLQLFNNPGPRPDFPGYLKLFFGGIKMVEFEGLYASIVTTNHALSSLQLYRSALGTFTPPHHCGLRVLASFARRILALFTAISLSATDI
jgi:hypothetical protein